MGRMRRTIRITEMRWPDELFKQVVVLFRPVAKKILEKVIRKQNKDNIADFTPGNIP